MRDVNNHSTVSLTTLLIAIFIAFGLGAAWKLNRMARRDLLDTKAKIPKLRRFYWITSMWLMIKWGIVVAVALYATVQWVQRDRNDNGPTPLIPTRSADPRPKQKPKPKRTIRPYVPKTFGLRDPRGIEIEPDLDPVLHVRVAAPAPRREDLDRRHRPQHLPL